MSFTNPVALGGDSLKESDHSAHAVELNSPFSSSQLNSAASHLTEMTDEEIQEMMINSQPLKYEEKTAELGSLLPRLPAPMLKSVATRVAFDIKQLSAGLFEAEEVVSEENLPTVLKNKSAAEIELYPRLQAIKHFSELIKINDRVLPSTTDPGQSFKSITTGEPLDHAVESVPEVRPPAPLVREAVIEYVEAERPAKVKYDQIETPDPKLPQPPIPVLKTIKAVSQKIEISADVSPVVDAARESAEITTGVMTKIKYGHFDTPPPEMPKVPMPMLRALKSPSSPVPSEAEFAAAERPTPTLSEMPPPTPAPLPAPGLALPPLQSASPEAKASYPVVRIPVQFSESASPSTVVSLDSSTPIRPIQRRASDKVHVTPGRVFSTGTTQPIPLNPRSHPASAPTLWDDLKTLWKKWTRWLR
jgi:hypothetical protein